MRAAGRAVWPAAVGLGIVAEAAGRPPLPALDAATGFSLVALGFLAWRRQPRYAVGWILAAAGERADEPGHAGRGQDPPDGVPRLSAPGEEPERNQ